ncbi:metal ABC transporter permease, partial [Xanthomonas citri pv. citri]|nr:metal ABC transporter permease [Xanthomonas citri pv. citri]
MPPDSPTTTTPKPVDGYAALRRFLPYLWPADRPALRLRVAVALLLVLASKTVTLALPFAYKGAIDRMAP